MICLGQIILQLIECHKQAEFNKLIRVTAGDKFLCPFWSRHGNIFLRDFSESQRRASKCVKLISRQNFSLSHLCVVEIEPVQFTGHRSTFPEHLLGKQPKKLVKQIPGEVGHFILFNWTHDGCSPLKSGVSVLLFMESMSHDPYRMPDITENTKPYRVTRWQWAGGV